MSHHQKKMAKKSRTPKKDGKNMSHHQKKSRIVKKKMAKKCRKIGQN